MVEESFAREEMVTACFSKQPTTTVQSRIDGVLKSAFKKEEAESKELLKKLVDNFVRIAVLLGNGTKTPAQNGLAALEDAMLLKLKSRTTNAEGAVDSAKSYFSGSIERQKVKWSQQDSDKSPGAQERSPYSKLLTEALGEKEVENGFAASPAGVPIYLGRLADLTFIEASKSGKPFKDLVSAEHGEFTHRIQWYIVMTSAKLDYGASALFKLINVIPNLWDYLFDRVKNGEAWTVNGEDDYRGPEVLLKDLTTIRANTFPLLSSFLLARQAKRNAFNQGYGWNKEYASRKKYKSAYANLNIQQKEEVDLLCTNNLYAR